ncbi:YbfB/YjiJ family MFS transporter [Cohnella abietis]|uniref:MFS transporter n=1 Tax=Cohnella abietis TaxID=2507935 RepID=A0A3T1DBV7_9BACL|nr:YbfB/YjiJ family MFS transporter [Cohnella abietis]BBI35583.1 MFS transporter [Cohnella abietis]
MSRSDIKVKGKATSTKILIGGFVMLTIAMGIGRFSYTSILPFMQSQINLSITEAGYLAGINNLGYLAAAFCAGFINFGARRSSHLRIHLVLCILTTGLMGVTSSFSWWMILRFISGFSSGFIFVLASSLVLDALLTDNREKWIGIFYGGVGFGIALSGLLIPLFSLHSWRGAWIGLLVVSIILVAIIWRYIQEPKKQHITVNGSDKASSIKETKLFLYLLIVYGLEGLGYVVSATFLVSYVKQVPKMEFFSDYSWIIVGVAAVPSTLFWSWCMGKMGYVKPLIFALILQAIGVILPVLLPNIFGVALGSILFGGTFMGISMLAITAARSLKPTSGSQAIALMTGFFGTGQILGPVGAGFVLDATNSYSISLALATLVLVIAVIIMIVGSVMSNRKSLKNA